MRKSDSLAEFEHLVLLAVIRLGEDAYGMRIRQEIEDTAQRDAAIGAVYITLDRLVEKRYVSSYLGEATAERGGRAKRFFRVEGAGMKALRNTQEAIQRMSVGVQIIQEAV